MAPIVNRRVLYNEVPTGYPVPGKTTKFDSTDIIDLDNITLNGGVLVKTLIISPDPYMRGRMRDPSVKSYSAPFNLNEPINGHGIALVLRSELDAFKPGDKLYGFIGWQDYNIIPESFMAQMMVLPHVPGVPLSSFLGANGMPGQTAFYGLKAYSNMKPGETIFVSTGAGAVGAIVCQLAKHAGLKVIASTGSDDKVEWLTKELGVDVAFNYKTTSTLDILEKQGPIDIYWDNVGGSTLEAAIAHSNVGGRIILCGAISGYNSGGDVYGIKNLSRAIGLGLSINGFVVRYLLARYGTKEFYDEMPKLVAEGKVKIKEHVTIGLENAEQALGELFKGDNFGKAVVIVAEE